jgi:hypothetical protein
MANDDEALTRVLSGRSWDEFCDGLKAAGQVILRPEAPATELDRAEGWRYLTRLTRVALEMMLEHSDPDFPVFYQASHTTVKIGADNPDNIYLNATIAPDRVYRVRGNRGTVPYLSFGTKANRYATDGTMASTGEIDAPQMQFGVDGSFEILVSREKQAGNWLPMEADTSMLIVRQTFLDRPNERPAQVTIEAVGGPKQPAPLTARKLDSGLRASAAFVRGTARTFADWSQMFQPTPNAFAPIGQEICWKTGGDPNIHYLHGYWALGSDEALLIETPVPECEIWNFQLDNYWMESLDYRYLPVHVNSHTAKYERDGSVRIVIAAQDPGVGNFLDTAGHTSGTMLLRWTRASSHPVPKCSVVKLAALRRSG